MPRFFFDTIALERTDRDPDGVELPDEQAARRMAWGCLSDLIADAGEPPDGTLSILVGDASRRPVYEVYAVATSPGPGIKP